MNVKRSIAMKSLRNRMSLNRWFSALITTACLLMCRPSVEAAPKLWDHGVVYFEFDASLDSVDRNKMRSSMDRWSQSAVDVVFLPRNGLTTVPYVLITHDNSRGNYTSDPGQPSSVGSPRVNNYNDLGMGNNWFRLHELGHVLGFDHEMKRPDRNTYLALQYANINPTDVVQYDPTTSDMIYDTSVFPFCFESIMMYAQCNNTICNNCPNDNNCPEGGINMKVLSPNESWQNKLGTDGWNSSTSQLPDCDIDRLVSAYGSGSVRYVDKNDGGDALGTLRDPYKSFDQALTGAPLGARVYLNGAAYEPTNQLHRAMQLRAYPNTTATIR